MKAQPSRTGDLRRDYGGLKNCSCAAQLPPSRILGQRNWPFSGRMATSTTPVPALNSN
jgi:hypothetical protein